MVALKASSHQVLELNQVVDTVQDRDCFQFGKKKKDDEDEDRV